MLHVAYSTLTIYFPKVALTTLTILTCSPNYYSCSNPTTNIDTVLIYIFLKRHIWDHAMGWFSMKRRWDCPSTNTHHYLSINIPTELDVITILN